VGLLFFSLVKTWEPTRARLYGWAVGGALGAVCLVIVLVEQPPNTIVYDITVAVWVLGQFVLWGLGLARAYVATTAPPVLRATSPEGPAADRELAADVARIDRRRFLIRLGGAAATVIVVGAEVAEILSVEGGPKAPTVVKAPIPFPNADSPVRPVPGTRPEYTAVADHYRVDIDLSPPQIDGSSWRLRISGLVGTPVSLTLAQLKADFPSVDRFVTLACVSNPVGGPLIGTTLWTGAPLRDVLQSVAPQSQARFAHLLSQDGFDEVVDLALVRSDPRVMLVYAWNGQPLPPEHGYPLRVYIPDRYGMKQPNWITDVVLAADFSEGYWVKRGWDQRALMKTTSVIDVVGSDQLVTRGGETLVPVGGIAHAGDRGISKVEVQVDNGPWQAAELRQPLSGLTWVLWRFEWPFSEGQHVFAVRAYDGQGMPQIAQPQQPFPSGASGIFKQEASLLPTKLSP
jgi:DMSO/TMAO reductase YedYZ molybdopterin-dependent catalytic subunit